MRKRTHHISLWLSENEYQHLQAQIRITGLGTSSLLRQLIAGAKLRPRPPDAYGALLRELSAIGNNINQIAHTANAQRGVSEGEIDDAAQLVRRAWRLIKNSF